MTGYGQSERETDRFRVAVTIYSYNHRFLDAVVRLPEAFRRLEAPLRERLGRTAKRGHCEVGVSLALRRPGSIRVEVHREALAALRDATAEWVAAGLVRPEISLGDLARNPALVSFESDPEEFGSADESVLLAVFDDAVGTWDAARAAEGTRLEVVLRDCLSTLRSTVARISERRGEAVADMSARLRSRLDELLAGVPVDESRLAQEAAVLVDRSDVREELDRLRGHLDELERALGTDGGIGRKLDFLLQETLRELTTLGAKSRDRELGKGVLEAKLAVEQLREQAQNIE